MMMRDTNEKLKAELYDQIWDLLSRLTSYRDGLLEILSTGRKQEAKPRKSTYKGHETYLVIDTDLKKGDMEKVTAEVNRINLIIGTLLPFFQQTEANTTENGDTQNTAGDNT